MANENKPDTNHSQFFITLDATTWLNGKHTIFGKVVGNTLFNVLKMGELETGEDDRPLYPPMIESVSVLVNPFPDIVPRSFSLCHVMISVTAQPTAPTEEKKPVRQVKQVKNNKLLSFADEEEDDDGNANSSLIRKNPFHLASSAFNSRRVFPCRRSQ